VAALFVGIAKTGVPGFGTLAVPLMVLAVGDARLAAGWLLPLLCVADLFAVGFYLRQSYARRLMALLPWVLVGMALGALALGAPERLLRPTVAVVVLVMIAVRWVRTRGAIFSDSRAPDPAPQPGATTDRASAAPVAPWLNSAIYGGSAGFATTIANAAGPIMSLYLLAQRLPKDEFVGTGVWFFLIVNLCKVPVYVGHGLLTARSLAFDAALLPAVVVGAVLGRVLLRRLSQGRFERVVLALTVLASALLFIPR